MASYVFTILFLIEMILKVFVYGFNGYISNNWNKFFYFI
ncbi:MAG: ion transporter [bacterium]